LQGKKRKNIYLFIICVKIVDIEPKTAKKLEKKFWLFKEKIKHKYYLL
jgi:hypothetical protein